MALSTAMPVMVAVLAHESSNLKPPLGAAPVALPAFVPMFRLSSGGAGGVPVTVVYQVEAFRRLPVSLPAVLLPVTVRLLVMHEMPT